MRRALTEAEKTLLETHPQKTKMYLYVDNPDPIFTCQEDGFYNVDTHTFNYDNGSGSGVLSGMTLILGSTPGGRDLAKVRVKSCSGGATGTITVAENPDVTWSNDKYVSILPIFELWSVFPRIVYSGGKDYWYKDFDEAFVNTKHGQTRQLAPVAIMGPPAIAFLDEATVDVDFVGEWSYAIAVGYYGSGDMGLSATCDWQFAGGAPADKATLGTEAAPHTIAYNATGRYLASLEVANDQGGGAAAKTHTGYRYIHILPRTGVGSPYTDFQLLSLRGDWQSGGWTGKIRVFGDADTDEFPDGAEIILFAEEWYGDTKQSIGGYPGRENIKLRGWIVEESTKVDFDQKGQRYVEFEIVTLDGIMKARNAFPCTVEDARNTPGTVDGTECTDWYKMYRLQIDRAAYYLIKWHTTLMQMTDINILGDNTNIAAQDFPSASIYRQLDDYSASVCIGRVLSDKQSSIFIDRDVQCRIGGQRSSIVELMKLDKDSHLREGITFPRKQVAPVKFVEVAGVHWDGRTGTAYIGQAPGRCPKQDGQDLFKKGLAFEELSEANFTAGYVLDEANTWKGIPIKLQGNFSFLDIAPQAWLTMDVAAADNKRGIEWMDEKLIVRSVELKYDSKASTLLTDTKIDTEATGTTGVTGDYTSPPEIPAPPGTPSWKIPGWNGIAYLGTENGVYSRQAGLGYWESITPRSSPFSTTDPLQVFDMCFNPHRQELGRLTDVVIATSQGVFQGVLDDENAWTWTKWNVTYPTAPTGWLQLDNWDAYGDSAEAGRLDKIVADTTLPERYVVYAYRNAAQMDAYLGVTLDAGDTWTWLPLPVTYYDGSTYYRPTNSEVAMGGLTINSGANYVDVAHENGTEVRAFHDDGSKPLTWTATVGAGTHPVLGATERLINFVVDLGAMFYLETIEVKGGHEAGFKIVPEMTFKHAPDNPNPLKDLGFMLYNRDSLGYGVSTAWDTEGADAFWIEAGAVAWRTVWTKVGVERVYARYLLFDAYIVDTMTWVDQAQAFVESVRVTVTGGQAGRIEAEYPSLQISSGPYWAPPPPRIYFSSGGHLASGDPDLYKACRIFICEADGSAICDFVPGNSHYRNVMHVPGRIFVPFISYLSPLSNNDVVWLGYCSNAVYQWWVDNPEFGVWKSSDGGRTLEQIENPASPMWGAQEEMYDLSWLATDENDIMALGSPWAFSEISSTLLRTLNSSEWNAWSSGLPVKGSDNTTVWPDTPPKLIRHLRTANILMVLSPYNASVLLSLNSGGTWARINEGLPENLMPVCGLLDWGTA